MVKSLYIHVATAIFMAMILQACSGDNPYGVEMAKDAYIYKDIDYEDLWINFDMEHEESVWIDASDGLPWRLTPTESWISVSQTSGVGPESVRISVDDNDKTTPRSGYVEIESTRFNKYQTIYIAQEGTYFEVLNGSSETWYETFEEDAGSVTVNVRTNSNWSIDSKPYWITITPSEGKPGQTSVTISASKNTGDGRSGEIWFKHAADTRYFGVSQSGHVNVTATTEYWSDLSKAGGDWAKMYITASNSTNWTLTSNRTWVRFNNSPTLGTVSTWSGSGNAEVYVRTPPNNTYSNRTATITLKVGSTTIDSWTITQYY